MARLVERCTGISEVVGSNPGFTAPFNNMRTLTFKAQPTNAFFATVNQVFGDSSQNRNEPLGETHFYTNGFILTQRQNKTWKWPITETKHT